jgi:hypothetical protein
MYRLAHVNLGAYRCVGPFRTCPVRRVAHLVAAAHRFAPHVQLVLCAGAPDTPEIAAEVAAAVTELAAVRTGVFWVREMLPTAKIGEILSAATVFVCPFSLRTVGDREPGGDGVRDGGGRF